tara:strand:+ start:213 stop:569 length:357 start_codon:yes stop_codon:yes gene_type:complete
MKKGLFIALLTILTLSFAPDLFAASADIDEAAVDLTNTTQAVGSLFGWVVAFAGGIFAFLGIVGLKKYADDSRQNPLMKPMIMFVAGSLALGFTVFTGMLTKTTTNSDQENENVFEAK